MKRPASRRSTRLADQITRELATALVEEVRDPRLELVTISGVALNADMSIARVYYTLSGDEARLAAALPIVRVAPRRRKTHHLAVSPHGFRTQ